MALPWLRAGGAGEGPVVTVLDAMRDAHTGVYRQAVERAAAGRIAWLRGRDIGARVIALDDEVRARGTVDEERPAHLVVLGLQRADDLWPSATPSFDDDAPPDPGEAFAHVLAEGPRVGVHVAVWADTAQSATKRLGYEAVKEFSYIVGHRMDVASSEALLGDPIAASLATAGAAIVAPARDLEVISALLAPEPAALERTLETIARAL